MRTITEISLDSIERNKEIISALEHDRDKLHEIIQEYPDTDEEGILKSIIDDIDSLINILSEDIEDSRSLLIDREKLYWGAS